MKKSFGLSKFLFVFSLFCFVDFFVCAEDVENFGEVESVEKVEFFEEGEGVKNSTEQIENDNENTNEKDVITECSNYINKSKNLHLSVYQDQNKEFLVLNNHTENKVLTLYSNDKIIRYKYLFDLRLSEVEIWNCSKTVKESYLSKKTFYFYNESNKLSLSKKLIYKYLQEEYDIVNKKMTQSFFDFNENLIEKNEYSYVNLQDEENNFVKIFENQFLKNKRKDFVFYYRYNEQNKILLEEETHFEYKTPNSFYKIKTNVRKNIYEYIKEDCPPSLTFYENGKLRMKTVYFSKDDYVQNIYFDFSSGTSGTTTSGNSRIVVEYRKGKKYLEKIIQDSEVVMTKKYE